jgi:hypothetical protein
LPTISTPAFHRSRWNISARYVSVIFFYHLAAPIFGATASMPSASALKIAESQYE